MARKNNPNSDTQRRNDEIVKQRCEGHSIRDIAENLGLAPNTVHRQLQSILEGNHDVNLQLIRQLELLRIDDLWGGVWPKALEGDTEAADLCLRLMDRRAALLGLDIATR